MIRIKKNSPCSCSTGSNEQDGAPFCRSFDGYPVDGVGVGESRAAHKECPKQPFSQCLLICQRMRSAGKYRLRALQLQERIGVSPLHALAFQKPMQLFLHTFSFHQRTSSHRQPVAQQSQWPPRRRARRMPTASTPSWRLL